MDAIKGAFKQFLTYQSPWTIRQRFVLAGAMFAGVAVFMFTYRALFHEFFSSTTQGPRPLFVWVASAIFLIASLLPRLAPTAVPTYRTAVVNSFAQGLGLYAIMGLATSLLAPLPFLISSILYILFMIAMIGLVGMAYPSKSPQPTTA